MRCVLNRFWIWLITQTEYFKQKHKENQRETYKNMLACVQPKAKGYSFLTFFFFWRACCQINSQPLNLKVLLTERSGPSSLFIVALHLQLMELQKTMLLSFCVPTKSAGCLDNEKKQRRRLNSTLREGARGWGMETRWPGFSMFGVNVLAMLRHLSKKKKIFCQTYRCIKQTT